MPSREFVWDFPNDTSFRSTPEPPDLPYSSNPPDTQESSVSTDLPESSDSPDSQKSPDSPFYQTYQNHQIYPIMYGKKGSSVLPVYSEFVDHHYLSPKLIIISTIIIIIGMSFLTLAHSLSYLAVVCCH